MSIVVERKRRFTKEELVLPKLDWSCCSRRTLDGTFPLHDNVFCSTKAYEILPTKIHHNKSYFSPNMLYAPIRFYVALSFISSRQNGQEVPLLIVDVWEYFPKQRVIGGCDLFMRFGHDLHVSFLVKERSGSHQLQISYCELAQVKLYSCETFLHRSFCADFISTHRRMFASSTGWRFSCSEWKSEQAYPVRFGIKILLKRYTFPTILRNRYLEFLEGFIIVSTEFIQFPLSFWILTFRARVLPAVKFTNHHVHSKLCLLSPRWRYIPTNHGRMTACWYREERECSI